MRHCPADGIELFRVSKEPRARPVRSRVGVRRWDERCFHEAIFGHGKEGRQRVRRCEHTCSCVHDERRLGCSPCEISEQSLHALVVERRRQDNRGACGRFRADLILRLIHARKLATLSDSRAFYLQSYVFHPQ